MELKPTITEAACGESREEGKESGESFTSFKARADPKHQVFNGGMRTPTGCIRKLHLSENNGEQYSNVALISVSLRGIREGF